MSTYVMSRMTNGDRGQRQPHHRICRHRKRIRLWRTGSPL